MNINNEITQKKRNNKKLPKIKSQNSLKIISKERRSEPILLYKKYSTKLGSKTKQKNKKNKKRKLRHISVLPENKNINIEETDKNKIKLNRINYHLILKN